MYIALQKENGISCLTITENIKPLTMTYGERNHK
jgi:hypothetical protein